MSDQFNYRKPNFIDNVTTEGDLLKSYSIVDSDFELAAAVIRID